MGITTDGQEPPSVPGDDTVDSEAIIDGEVMEQDIANGAVTNGKIANGAVDDAKITGPISAGKLDLSSRVAVAGDTMTGQLKLVGDPLADEDAARKKYVDDAVGAIDLTPYVEKSGSTMTGNLVMSGGADIELGSGSVVLGTNQGIQALNGAPGNALLNSGSGGSTYFITNFDGTLKWGPGGAVDTELRRVGVGTIAMGAGDKIQQNEAPTVGDDLTNKTYVDGAIPSTAADIANVPAGGIAATDVQAALNELDQEKVAKAGDTMTGTLNVGNTPSTGVRIETSGGIIGFASNSFLALQNSNSVNNNTILLKQLADSRNRFIIRTGGQLRWGDGATNQDVTLERIAANTLGLSAGDQIQVQQDPAVDNDLARKKYVDDQITNETAFGDHYEYNRNVASATTTLTTPIERARVDLTGMAAGDYLVVGQAHFSTSNANARIKLQIVQDPDGAPVELDSQITVGPAVSVTGTMYFVAQVTLPAGSESFAVRFWHDSGSGSSTLEESTIYAHRVA